MIIRKEIEHKKCRLIITLDFDGTEYKGYCPICDKEIIESAYGDEKLIAERYEEILK